MYKKGEKSKEQPNYSCKNVRRHSEYLQTEDLKEESIKGVAFDNWRK